MTKSIGTVLVIAALAAVAALAASPGCSNSADDSGSGADSPAGLVIGPPDSHCLSGDGGLKAQTIGVCDVIDPALIPASTATCNVSFNQNASDAAGDDVDAATQVDAAAGDDDDAAAAAGDTSGYGPTMYGAAGNDDDCKYYVSWTATPIKENADTYFTVTAVRLADMTPAICAGIRPDVSLSIDHGVPAPKDPSTEIAPGVYKVGPVRFNAPGIWTVRFHLFEECDDEPEDSPHGHVAFYVQVP